MAQPVSGAALSAAPDGDATREARQAALGGALGGLLVALLFVLAAGIGPAAAGHDAAEPPPALDRFGPTLAIEDRVVTLADPGARRYLRYSLVLQFASTAGEGEVAEDELDPAQLERYRPAVEDLVTIVLSSKSAAELSTPVGRERVKSEIEARARELLDGRAALAEAYLTELALQ